ncbi:basic membrane protein A [Actinoalloteichus hoggarensis]|uniref:Membrane lipoprotein TmpC n=1 Tax=Actinoalloteichus hoggarensis TaxID=1470176 RepID=A0A221W3A2_9PSEU|nr:BMP family ABC transporter substrate-binding protein [Actinoalloteichus hoggarensis]ASO20214.1 Membrane lipoprotein TmpC precursor [Actinoalloteichus hoggarensis]MBB5919073.1 basic membrane protein A [Actinoalloteichus hoggarensis]
MPRSLRYAAVLSLTAVAAMSCNASSNEAEGDGTGGPSFVLITPNPIGVNDFLRLSVEGVERAAEQHGGTSDVYESSDPASIQQNMAAAVREAPDVIVAVGFNFADVLAQEAERNPEQQFLFIDSCTEQSLPNVTCATFREHEASYLAGAQAGLLTETDHVGAVVVLDSPQFHRFSDPFGEGAAQTNPDVEFTQLFIGGQNPFNDPARAKELAGTLAGEGVDHVMGAASAAGNLGVFEAAEEGGFFAFGVDSNQCPASPGQVVDNVVKRTDVVIADGIDAILGGAPGDDRSYGLAEDGLSLSGLLDDTSESQCTIAEHPEVIEEIAALRDQIVAGEITVADPAGS